MLGWWRGDGVISQEGHSRPPLVFYRFVFRLLKSSWFGLENAVWVHQDLSAVAMHA